ncbi:hypothetical protein [Enterococcus innesii]|uniref:hypothetical protein n=1 Tax=Enterococcus innesii TaxID=2839759 RepID=UPI003BC2BD67
MSKISDSVFELEDLIGQFESRLDGLVLTYNWFSMKYENNGNKEDVTNQALNIMNEFNSQRSVFQNFYIDLLKIFTDLDSHHNQMISLVKEKN